MTIAPIETTRDKLYWFATELKNELNDSLKNKSIKDSYSTKSFLEFLIDCQNDEKKVDIFNSSIIFGSSVYSHSSCFNSKLFSKIVSDYINSNKKDFNEFIENCRRVAKNVLKKPSVRLDWNSNYLKNSRLDYDNFIDYLKK